MRNRETGVLVLTYVDDVVVIGPDDKCVQFLDKLRERFKTTDYISLRECSEQDPLRFLCHELWIDQDEVFHVRQEEYTEAILERLLEPGARKITTLNSEDFKYDLLKDSPLVDEETHSKYRSIVGALMYLVIHTRGDIVTPVCLLAEFQAGPTEACMKAADKLLRYLRHVQHIGIAVPIKSGSLAGEGRVLKMCSYFDANFASERARSGGVLCLGPDSSSLAPVYWYSRRQKCICLSTTEAELVAASVVGKETIGLRNLVLSMFPDLIIDIDIRGDNNAANLIANSQAGLRKVRHLSLADLYIRQIIGDHGILVHRVDSKDNPSDMGTKVLGEQLLSHLREIIFLKKHEPANRSEEEKHS